MELNPHFSPKALMTTPSEQVYRAYLEEMICGSILDGSVQHIALVRQILDGVDRVHHTFYSEECR
jgi:hypothetical protein